VPAPVHAFDAVVLAGGRGTRLGGTDKPGLIVGGQTLLGAVVSAVTSAGADRIVVVGPERPAALGPRQVRYTREELPGGGPVPALRRGLDEVTAPAVVLLAADLPFLRPEHVGRLLTALGPDGRDFPGVVLLDDSGRPQWLVSCWLAELLRAGLDRYPGSSMSGLLAPLDPVLLSDETPAGDLPPWFDCDTDEDLHHAREVTR
jgi:molybdopterin-guanine dinucleotide biosynthesis protein A